MYNFSMRVVNLFVVAVIATITLSMAKRLSPQERIRRHFRSIHNALVPNYMKKAGLGISWKHSYFTKLFFNLPVLKVFYDYDKQINSQLCKIDIRTVFDVIARVGLAALVIPMVYRSGPDWSQLLKKGNKKNFIVDISIVYLKLSLISFPDLHLSINLAYF